MKANDLRNNKKTLVCRLLSYFCETIMRIQIAQSIDILRVISFGEGTKAPQESIYIKFYIFNIILNCGLFCTKYTQGFHEIGSFFVMLSICNESPYTPILNR